MIEEYTLKKLCDKYNISADKIIRKNNNILERGQYLDIDKTLNYLIIDLHIDPGNIEKCPSVLYRNVDDVKLNYEFLLNNNVSVNDINTCLNVLSTDHFELKKTYYYVLENYGMNAINKITSILGIPKERIIEIENLNLPLDNKIKNLSVAIGINNVQNIEDIIHSEEFKKYPELFASQVLAQLKVDDIKRMINSEEFKNYPYLFTSEVLTHTKIEDIKDIIHSEEFKNHPELFTSSTLAHAKIKDIKDMIHSEEFKKYPELFTSSTLAKSNIRDIKDMIHSEEFKNHPELFTSTTLAKSNIEDIKDTVHSEEFKNYPYLFTSEVLAHKKIKDIRDMIHSEEFKKYPELFTSSTLAHAKIEDIKDMIHSEEFKKYPELFTSTTLAKSNIENIRDIIRSEEFKKHPELFTSEVLARSKLENIRKLLCMPYWEDDRFKELLNPTIVSRANSMIKKLPILINMAIKYGIDNVLNTNFLVKSPSQNYALIKYIIDNNIDLVVNGKLNSLFSYHPGVLKKKFKINLKELIVKYPFDQKVFSEGVGISK